MLQNESKVVELISALATLKVVKCLTFDDIRLKLNQHLSKPLPDTKHARNQIERWMCPHRKAWVEPRGEIVLAMQEVVNSYK